MIFIDILWDSEAVYWAWDDIHKYDLEAEHLNQMDSPSYWS